jgi:hypothetical protein
MGHQFAIGAPLWATVVNSRPLAVAASGGERADITAKHLGLDSNGLICGAGEKLGHGIEFPPVTELT